LGLSGTEPLLGFLKSISTIAFFKQIVDIFFNKAYYQESYILIIGNSSVVTVAEWLDLKCILAIQKKTNEPTASNNKSDRPQVNIWNI
jgi:hypothetical protein